MQGECGFKFTGKYKMPEHSSLHLLQIGIWMILLHEIHYRDYHIGIFLPSAEPGSSSMRKSLAIKKVYIDVLIDERKRMLILIA